MKNSSETTRPEKEHSPSREIWFRWLSKKTNDPNFTLYKLEEEAVYEFGDDADKVMDLFDEEFDWFPVRYCRMCNEIYHESKLDEDGFCPECRRSIWQ